MVLIKCLAMNQRVTSQRRKEKRLCVDGQASRKRKEGKKDETQDEKTDDADRRARRRCARAEQLKRQSTTGQRNDWDWTRAQSKDDEDACALSNKGRTSMRRCREWRASGEGFEEKKGRQTMKARKRRESQVVVLFAVALNKRRRMRSGGSRIVGSDCVCYKPM